MAEGTVQFAHIYIASRGGVNQGPLKVSPGGMAWRSSGGGKVIEIKKESIEGLFWTKNSRVCQLGVRTKDAPTTNFLGFREKDLDTLRDICQNQLGQEIKDLPMSIAGHNWGALAINNGSLMFTVDQRVALELPLRDVSQAQQAKDDVMMEFHTDDTVMDNNTDVLCEISFHVPQTNDIFQSEDIPAAKNLLDQVLKHTDAGATSTDDAVCSFPDVAILNPRGRFEVEMHLSSLNLVGQTQDFKIRYSSVQRLFILPKSNTPHTLVVVSMDPPIRKGQTYYTHVLCQFPSDDRVEDVELDITPEQLAAKNEKCNNKLEAKLSGPLHDVFARALRGLSGAKISRAGAFRNATNEPAIRCAYKSDDGHLYPLDRAFFYVHKPPMLLPFEEVDGVEFARQGGGVVSSRTFDLVVRMKNDTEHQFRNISRTEWQSLFDFINAKKLRIENLDSAAQGPGGPQRGLQVDDDIDPGMRYAEAEIETEEDDEDFALGASDGSGSDDDASGLSGEGSEDSGDAEMVAEEGISVAAVTKGKRRGGAAGNDAGPSGPSPPAKRAKRSKGDGGGGDDDGKPEKKKRAKKDPNAPKKGLSGFMFFSSANREKVKEDNPGIGFGEIGKVLGERWKAMSAEEKQPYEDKAAQDKERYASEIAAYKGNDAKPAKNEEDDFIADDDEAED